MNTIIEFKKCGQFGRNGEWTKRSLQRYIGATPEFTKTHNKSQMCEKASLRAQKMISEIIDVRATTANINMLKAHQERYLKEYLILSPPTDEPNRNEKYWGRYDTSFLNSLLDFCNDGAAGQSMSFYLKGDASKFPKNPNLMTIEHANKANTLNTLIQQAPPSPVDLVLFRGVDTGDPLVHSFDENAPYVDFLKIGLFSTSYVKQEAINFLTEGDSCCLCVLLCPAGTRCLCVDSRSAWSDEREIMLPSGNLFRLQHSYYETVKNSNVEKPESFDVRVLVCVLEKQFLPNTENMDKIVPRHMLSRQPYEGQYVPPPTHPPYVPPLRPTLPEVIDLVDDDDDY